MSSTRSHDPKAPATDPSWRSAALVLAAHGLETGIGAAARHAATIQERQVFGEVQACRLRGAPTLGDACAQIHADRIYVVPFLMAEGFIARRLIPAALAETDAGGRRLNLCRSVGINPAMTEIIAAKARKVCQARRWQPKGTDLLLIGHGTPRDTGSATIASRHAAGLAETKNFARIAVGFLEQAPRVEDVLSTMRPRRCVAVGLFADRGPHGEDDVLMALADWRDSVVYAGPVGEEPAITEVILDQVRQADREPAGPA